MSIKDIKEYRDENSGKKSAGNDKLFCATCREKRFIVSSGHTYAFAEVCPECMSPCPACDDEGYVLETSRIGSKVARPCKVCGPARERYKRFNRAKIPKKFAHATLDSFEETGKDGKKLPNPALFRFMQLRDRLKVGDKGVGLSGNVGLGKTHLLCGLVRQLALDRPVHKQLECRFIEFTHLLADIRAGYDEGVGEAAIIGELAEVPVLVIDELGKGLTTSWQMNILDELISRRYNRDVTTFFATNYPFSSEKLGGNSRDLTDDFKRVTLEEKIGMRMFSRLSEMCEFMTITGTDYRKANS
jgi:DNA replication protein DnaC